MTGHPQAEFLRALADHLDTHQLPAVIVHWHGWDPIALQLLDADATKAIVAWARSLNVDEAEAREIGPDWHVAVSGRIGDHNVRTWGPVPRGRVRPTPRPGVDNTARIPVDEFEAGGAQ